MKVWRDAVIIAAAAALASGGAVVLTEDGRGYQRFSNGYAVWSAAGEPGPVVGAIGRKYHASGFERGYGYPATDEWRI